MQFLEALLYNTWSILKSVSGWMMVSFLIAGMLHNLLRPEIWQRNLGNKRFSSLLKATFSGALLPICSCGVVPIGLGLYYSGAYIGNVLAFIIATPIINPAAVLISLATLGPKLTLVYVAAGLSIPLIVGSLANVLAGPELVSPQALASQQAMTQVNTLENKQPPLGRRLLAGLKWGFVDLGKEICQYVIPGALLAAFVLAIVPLSFIQNYLARPDMISILGISLLGAVIYVCAVGHIPFVAALIGAGAAPGIAITFLLTGAATNLPELVSIYRLIGKRTALVFCGSVVVLSAVFGLGVNLLLTDFVPVFDVSLQQGKLDLAGRISFSFPEWAENIFGAMLIGFFLWARLPKLLRFFQTKFAGHSTP